MIKWQPDDPEPWYPEDLNKGNLKAVVVVVVTRSIIHVEVEEENEGGRINNHEREKSNISYSS